mmetsp:Transcript_23385/g.38453  ORF Transcript_23385/g.38453 Transcript_23385/m.38453 type:complete len:123 (-) Transcript_23385:251-619(-)
MEKQLFDAVVCMEVVEHVNDPGAFVDSLSSLVQPAGGMVLSTLNRTPASFLLGIVAAEYVLRLVEPGTHSWSKFIKPEELAAYIRRNRLHVGEVVGMAYNPMLQQWRLTSDTSVNYALWAHR